MPDTCKTHVRRAKCTKQTAVVHAFADTSGSAKRASSGPGCVSAVLFSFLKLTSQALNLGAGLHEAGTFS